MDKNSRVINALNTLPKIVNSNIGGKVEWGKSSETPPSLTTCYIFFSSFYSFLLRGNRIDSSMRYQNPWKPCYTNIEVSKDFAIRQILDTFSFLFESIEKIYKTLNI
jgi:hypothetical protein